MTDRRHSLKRGDRLSKKERQTTASDWREKATNCDMCYGSKVTATFMTIKQATKQLQNERQATWVTPLVGLIIRHTALTSFFDLEFYSVLHV
jgi:hypothetical protein